MGNHVGGTNEFNQASHSNIGVGRISHIGITDVGEVGNLFRNGLARIHKGNVPTHDFAMHHSCSGNLNQFVMVERKARCLGIDDNNVFIEFPKGMLFRVGPKRMVAIANALRGIFKNISVKP